MSSDCYYVRVGKIAGNTVTLHCLTGFAGGLKDYANTRSFALLLLIDAQESADGTPELTKGAPKELAKLRKALARKVAKARSPLIDEVEWPRYDVHWHAENTHRYIKRVKLLKRHNAFHEQKLEKIREKLSPLQDKGVGAFLEAAWKQLHGFDLQVEVTDTKYLAHLLEGHLFSTAAFDIWDESRPLPPVPKKKRPAKPKPTAAPKGNYAGKILDSSFWRSTRDENAYNVSGSNFQGARLKGLSSVRYFKAMKCDFTQAKVTAYGSRSNDTTNIEEWNFKGTLFRGASLKNVRFIDCDLSHCDFTNADLRNARFLSSKLKGAIFKGANLKNALISPTLTRGVNLDEAKNHVPAPGGIPGAKCRALDRLIFQAKAIAFDVDYLTPNDQDYRVRISLSPSSSSRNKPPAYRLSLLTRGDHPKSTFTGAYHGDVGPGQFGDILRRASDDVQAPQHWKLDLSTLAVKSKGAPIDARAVKAAVQAALVEIFDES
ncbi:pentapeptide repeat-containing protein [Myxococcus stipitatus]|uniref:pentapeptide repeat-containing protein n=1 Tax=Myxococcus stipitatus TaxID=83455 RepID=UPI0030CD39DC